MSVTVLALVVAAAFAHAGWNLVAKPAAGGAAFVWLCAVAGTLLYLPVLVVALIADPGPLGWTAIAFMAVSGALHALYFVLLQRAYATGDLSVVYPLARGTGPLLSATAAIVFLGERPSAVALAGAALIVAAVFSLMGRGPTSLGAGRCSRFSPAWRSPGTRSGTSAPSAPWPCRRSSTTGARTSPTPPSSRRWRFASARSCTERGRSRGRGPRSSGCSARSRTSWCSTRWPMPR